MWLLGKNKLRVKVPNSWHTVPYHKALTIWQNPDMSDAAVFALLSGVSEEEIRDNLPIEPLSIWALTFTYLNQVPEIKVPELPNEVWLDGKRKILPHVVYNDPTDMGKCTVGMIEDMKHILNQASKNIESDSFALHKIFPELCAIYLQPLYNRGNYDYDQAQRLIPASKELDTMTVLNLGFFLLTKLAVLRSGHLQKWQNINLIKRKLMRVCYSLTQRLASIPL